VGRFLSLSSDTRRVTVLSFQSSALRFFSHRSDFTRLTATLQLDQVSTHRDTMRAEAIHKVLAKMYSKWPSQVLRREHFRRRLSSSRGRRILLLTIQTTGEIVSADTKDASELVTVTIPSQWTFANVERNAKRRTAKVAAIVVKMKTSRKAYSYVAIASIWRLAGNSRMYPTSARILSMISVAPFPLIK